MQISELLRAQVEKSRQEQARQLAGGPAAPASFLAAAGASAAPVVNAERLAMLAATAAPAPSVIGANVGGNQLAAAKAAAAQVLLCIPHIFFLKILHSKTK